MPLPQGKYQLPAVILQLVAGLAEFFPLPHFLLIQFINMLQIPGIPGMIFLTGVINRILDVNILDLHMIFKGNRMVPVHIRAADILSCVLILHKNIHAKDCCKCRCNHHRNLRILSEHQGKYRKQNRRRRKKRQQIYGHFPHDLLLMSGIRPKHGPLQLLPLQVT